MSEYEKVPPYYSPPPYNPSEVPPTGIQGPQSSGYPAAQPTGYPAPQSTGYPPQVPQTQMVMPTTTIIQSGGFGETPRRTVCPNCNATIMTRVTNETSNCQHLVCCFMFLTVACSIFSCLPYCCDSCANVRHECPQCRTHLGSYTR